MSNGHSRRQPQPGDLIEIHRPAYQHWALYLGDGYIINVVPPEGVSSAKSAFTGKAWVRKQLLKEAVGKDSYCVNNKYDAIYTPRPLKDIIQHAERLIDREVCYDVLTNNCEHFVTMLRYGKPDSEQVNRGVAAAGIATAVTAVLGALATVGLALSRA